MAAAFAQCSHPAPGYQRVADGGTWPAERWLSFDQARSSFLGGDWLRNRCGS